jgi:mannose-6-phosphate isomerase-like protein (cupin superfamily)
MQRMKDITTLHLASIAAYSGPHEIPGIRFRPARAALGVSAWGMNVLELDAGCEAYPEHEHSKDGQEEVYFVVRGGGELVAGEQRVALTEGTFVRVAPSVTRKILPGAEGIVVLAIGGTPGKPFEPTIA